MKLDLSLRRLSCEVKRTIRIHPQRPSVDPGQPRPFVETGVTEAPAARFVEEEEVLPVLISHSEVREFQVVDNEAGCGPRALVGWANALPEKSELVTEALAARIGQVAGEVPPFGPEHFVHMVIAR